MAAARSLGLFETTEEKLARARKELAELQAIEDGQRFHTDDLAHALVPAKTPAQGLMVDRTLDPRILRRKYIEQFQRMQAHLQKEYALEIQRLELEYQRQILEISKERQLTRERHRHIEDVFAGGKENHISVVTISAIPGFRVKEVCGTVTGAHLVESLGGEAAHDELRDLPVVARQEAYADLLIEAKKLGANAVVNFKWRTAQLSFDTLEVMAEGTALKVEKPGQDNCCKECGANKKGGKNQQNQGKKQNQQDGKGKGQKKKQQDSDASDDSEDNEDSDEDEGDGNRGKAQGKQGKGGKNKAGKGDKQQDKGRKDLSTIEALVKLLMESKIKQAKQNKAEKTRKEFLDHLTKFFEDQQYNASRDDLFEWTKNFGKDGNWQSGSGAAASQGNSSWGTLQDSSKQPEVGWGIASAKPDTGENPSKDIGWGDGGAGAAADKKKEKPSKDTDKAEAGAPSAGPAAPSAKVDQSTEGNWGAIPDKSKQGTTASGWDVPDTQTGGQPQAFHAAWV